MAEREMMKGIPALLLLLLSVLLPAGAQAYYPTSDGFNIYSSSATTISGTGIKAVAVQPWDGKVVIGGSFSATGSGATVQNLARINTDGTLDTSFAPAPSGPVNAISIQADKSIYIGGSFQKVGALDRCGLAHLNSAGAVDGFAPAGDPATVIDAILPRLNGILVGGKFASMGGKARSNLAMLNPDGSAADSFATGPDGEVMALLRQDDGMIVVGGSFSSPQPNLARFDADGVYDPSLTVSPPGTVSALAQQADGKVLFGGSFSLTVGAQTFSNLARLKIEGDLDTSFSPAPNDYLTSIALQPDGKILIGGNFTSVGGTERHHVARLNVDGTLDYNSDPHLDLNPDTDAVVNALFVQPDEKFLIAGDFQTVAGGAKTRTRLARYYPSGALDEDLSTFGIWWGPYYAYAMGTVQHPEGDLDLVGRVGLVDWQYNDGFLRLNPDWSYGNTFGVYLDTTVANLAIQSDEKVVLPSDFTNPLRRLNADGSLDTTFAPPTVDAKPFTRSTNFLRPGTKLPDGTPLEDGMMYVGGRINQTCLVRLKKDGSVDPTFHPPAWLCPGNEYVPFVFIQPDNRILTSNEDGRIVRLLTDGSEDPTFTPVQEDLLVEGVGLEPDGKHFVAFGMFSDVAVRFDMSGKVDPSFHVTGWNAEPAGDCYPWITSMAWQTDGKILIAGLFTTINGENRHLVARLLPNGQVDQTLDLGPFEPFEYMTYKMNIIRLQPDGKFFITGGFQAIDEDWNKGGLARFNNGWATQNLSVSLDGSTVTWLRGGTSPELWRVWFEHSSDGVTWTYLGEASRTAALDGWYLDGLNVFPKGENHYVRARGYAMNNKMADALLGTTRLFYLKPVITVTASAAKKTYGEGDPALSYTATGFVDGDTSAMLTGSLARATGEAVGSYAINQWTLSAGPKYSLLFTGADLAITPAPLYITADDQRKNVGDPDPPLTFTPTGFVNGDTAAILTGSLSCASSNSPGSYPITQGSLSAGSNYTIHFNGATLTVSSGGGGPLPQTITFPPLRNRTFGDGDFDPGATASSHLAVQYTSSANGIATPVGGKIRVLAPGSAGITASQGGDDQYLAAPDQVQPLTVNPPPWNGLGFDGIDDSLRVADAPQLNFGSKGGFTIECWLHLEGTQPDGSGLISKGEGGSGWYGYQLMLYKNRIAAEIGTAGGSVGVPEGLVGSSSLSDGQWHHVALAVDRGAGSATLYLDGRSEARVANPLLSGSPDNANPLLVGVDRSGLLFFKGEIDELRLWDIPRSRDEIRSALSQIIDPASEPHLSAYFHFDEGDAGLANASFPTAPERTSYGANGALQNFALDGPVSNWIRSGAFLPLLETLPVSSATSDSASAGATVYPNYYPPTDVGLCWGSAPNPGLSDHCLHSAGKVGTFSAVMTGLAPGAAYHFRAFATNAMGTAFGNDLTFRTGKLEQTINIGSLPGKTYGDPPFAPGGSSTSGLTISYSSSDPTIAQVVDGVIQVTGAGTVTITASQAGSDSYAPAEDVPHSLTVAKAALVVAADNKARAYLTANPPLTASFKGFVNGDGMTAITGLPILSTTALPSSPVGDYDIAVGTGALAARNYTFVPANGTLTVFKSCQQIIFPPIGDRTFGDPSFEIVASTCSGLSLGFTSSNPQVAQVSGGTLTITGAGSVTITASQQGNDSLDKAPDVSQTLTVLKSGQSLTFAPLPPKVLGDPPFALNATASSGLTSSYQSADPSVATVSGNLVTLVGSGTTVITASQNGNANYNPAPPISQPLVVSLEGEAPVLALSTLPSGTVTADPVLNIAGSASDPSGIASLTVNGVDLTAEAALFSSAVPLVNGENDITVTASDGFGNKASQTVSVTLDSASPVLAVNAPADNSVSNASSCTVSGTASAGSSLMLTVNGGAAQGLAVGEDGSFSGTGYLKDGLNTLQLTALLAGRSSTVKRSVTLAADKPFVAITEPVEDLRTEQQQVTVRGVAGAQGSEPTLALQIGSLTFTPTLQSGSFQQEITLDRLGPTGITATVTDRSGNSSVARRNVIRVQKVPGDLNGDGLVDIRDAVLLLRAALGIDPLTPQALAHGDLAPLVNGVPQPDGKLDAGDVLVLLRKIVGLLDF